MNVFSCLGNMDIINIDEFLWMWLFTPYLESFQVIWSRRWRPAVPFATFTIYISVLKNVWLSGIHKGLICRDPGQSKRDCKALELQIEHKLFTKLLFDRCQIYISVFLCLGWSCCLRLQAQATFDYFKLHIVMHYGCRVIAFRLNIFLFLHCR